MKLNNKNDFKLNYMKSNSHMKTNEYEKYLKYNKYHKYYKYHWNHKLASAVKLIYRS